MRRRDLSRVLRPRRPMTDHVETLIVGAGPTGLGAAWRLDTLGHDSWRLYEAEPVAGGLASSVTDERGFTWDLGGHVQFSHYDYFDRLMEDLLGPAGWLHHERQAWMWTTCARPSGWAATTRRGGPTIASAFRATVGRAPSGGLSPVGSPSAIRDGCACNGGSCAWIP